MPALAVTALSLSHFRSHRHLSLDLDARPVAIHGANGSGKTNLLEAVSLLSPGRGLRRAAPGEIARLPEAVGWRVGARLSTPREAHEIDLRAEAGGPRRTEVDGRAVPQTALGRLARVVWLVPAMDRLWIEGAEGRQALPRPHRAELRAHPRGGHDRLRQGHARPQPPPEGRGGRPGLVHGA